MEASLRWTIKDLELFPEPLDDTRYEIIDGELYVSHQPSLEHQFASSSLTSALFAWSRATGLGMVVRAPGVIFADDDNVAPDVVWISRHRLRESIGVDRKLHGAPELVIEVLSPGASNERRDREIKLGLYTRRGVDEYWIVDPERHVVDIYRRAGQVLSHSETLAAEEMLTSPLLPEFTQPVAEIFLPEDL